MTRSPDAAVGAKRVSRAVHSFVLRLRAIMRCASRSDAACAIPAPAQAEIRADPRRKEALRKEYLGKVRVISGARSPA